MKKADHNCNYGKGIGIYRKKNHWYFVDLFFL